MKKSTKVFISAVLASYFISSWGGLAWAATNLAPKDTDIVAGKGAVNSNYDSKEHGSVAIGANAETEIITTGDQEKWLALGQTEYSGSIAIGENTYARTGSVQIGIHNYTGKMGNVTVDANTNKEAKLVGMTTIGTNSYNKAAFGVITGTDSIISGSYDANKTGLAGYFNRSLYGYQNFGANIVGSLNSIESKDFSPSAGIANSIVGVANRTSNSNGSLIFGAGNEITNSISNAYDSSSFKNLSSAQALQEALMKSVKDSEGGGSVMAIGGGNTADYVQGSQIIGLNNTVKGTKSSVSKYNLFIGRKQTGTNVQYISSFGDQNDFTDANNDIVIGNNHSLNGVEDNIILGSTDEVTKHNVSGAVVIGHNAQSKVAGGVALGQHSVASVAQGVEGYDPSLKGASSDTSIAWKSTSAAVSVGDVDNNFTRQITGVAAGTNDTDAVNVAQLKQMAQSAAGVQPTVSAGTNVDVKKTGDAVNGYDYKISVDLSGYVTTDSGLNFGGDSGNTIKTKLNGQLDVKGGVTDAAKLTDNNIGVVSDGTGTLNIKLAKDLTGLDTVTVNKSVTVGDTVVGTDSVKTNTVTVGDTVSITKDGLDMGGTSITNVKAGVNTTDAVNYGQLKDLGTSLDNRITTIDNRVDDLDSRINKVGAGAAALASLHPLDFDPDDKWNFSVGFGNYKDANSLAVGAFYRPDDNTMFAIGTAMGNGDNMVNASINFKVGNSKHSLSRSSMDKRITSLQDSVTKLEKENQEIKAQNAALVSKLNQLLASKK